MITIVPLLRLLGDETRLRIVSLLSKTDLNVSELTSILGLAQSGVSRNLRQLKSAGLLQERKDGIWSYYQLVPEKDQKPELKLLIHYLKEQIPLVDDRFHDQHRLSEVLRLREEGPGLNERLLEPGQSWLAWSRLIGGLMPSLDVADLGCGDGTLTLEIARFSHSVVGVDHNAHFIELAQKKAQKLEHSKIRFLTESVESLSLSSESVDVVFFCQSLHHLQDPEKGLQQAFRILRPQGRLLMMDLESHQQHWVKEKLGHAWLGFDPKDLQKILLQCGFNQVTYDFISERRGEALRVLLVTAQKE